MKEKRSVRIVVVGDSKCGKTSLITTLVSSTFPEKPPPVLQQVHIPPEETSDNVALCITDTSSVPEDREHMLREVSQADVVILVYSVEDDSSKLFGPSGQLESWLLEISNAFKGPVLVVGNKVDLVSKEDSDRTVDLGKNISGILEKFGKQDLFWECSSKLNMNVSEVFNMAQHAVLYPLAPLFDTKTKELRPKFKKALCRVFRIFDMDRDGLLSDTELNDFQERCFGVRLTPTDLEQVKAVLKRQGAGLVLAQGISLEGFQHINKTFINRNRPETSWLVLRMFGYDDELEIQVPSSMYVLDDKARNQSVELSLRAFHFFEDLFYQFDRDKDGALSPTELEDLFSICPDGSHPWTDASSKSTLLLQQQVAQERLIRKEGVTKEDIMRSSQEQILSTISNFPVGLKTNENGYVDLAGWLAQWSMTTLLKPQTTLLHLQYLGYGMGPKNSTKLTRPRTVEDEENGLQRSTIRAFVFGATGVNKSAFLDALIRKTPMKKTANYTPNIGTPTNANIGIGGIANTSPSASVRSVVSMVKPKNANMTTAQYKRRGNYLVLTKIPANEGILEEVFSSGMVDCDLAIMLFDANTLSSVEYLRSVQQRIPETVPCVYLYNDEAKDGKKTGSNATTATNSESSTKSQARSSSGEESFDNYIALKPAMHLCSENSLPEPIPVVLDVLSEGYSRGKIDHLFELLMTTALKPDAARPISAQRRAERRRARLARAALRISFVTAVSVSSAWFLWSLFSNLGGGDSGSSTSSSSNQQHNNKDSSIENNTVREDFHSDYQYRRVR